MPFMNPIAAVRDLLILIPVRVRQVIYGVLGLVILLDASLHVMPDRIEDALTTVFGVFAAVMALANSTNTADA